MDVNNDGVPGSQDSCAILLHVRRADSKRLLSSHTPPSRGALQLGNMIAADVANLKDLVARVWGNEVLQELEDEDFRRLQDGKYTSKLRLEHATAESLIASGLNRAVVDVIVGRTSGQGSQQGPSSEALVDGMWQLAAPSLPKTHQQVEEWLFNHSGPQIPVTYRHYQQAKAKRPDAAQHFLTEGGDAEVAVAFTACLAREPPAQLTSESHTAGLVQQFLFTAFEGLKSYSRDRLQYSIRLNESAKDRSHTSRSQKEKVRPDTMVIAPITLGPLLDMATELGRYELLRTCIQAYRLLFVMKVNLADLPTRLAPYVILDRGDGRSLEWTKEGICKKIPDFQSYLKQQCTTLEAIEKAYQASNEAAQAARSKGQQPCLIGSIHPPRLLKQGYKVITSPQGFPPMVLSEEDLHAIALASCEAARILHTKGLVHRDLRFANIIELARRQYVVIDLESVAEVSSAALPGNFEQLSSTWAPAGRTVVKMSCSPRAGLAALDRYTKCLRHLLFLLGLVTAKLFWSSVAYKGVTSMADPIKEAQWLLLAELKKSKADRDEDLIKELKEFLMLTQASGQLPAQLYNRSRDLIEAHLCHLPSPKLPTNSQQQQGLPSSGASFLVLLNRHCKQSALQRPWKGCADAGQHSVQIYC
ncbi:hypothetical protein WJX74_002145 [Apatococcus lobatus]|uniref:Protein kinase domain-containing protein n=1 Tax=Apatococcus lobatus TaxID=904363 RepID=A0AAW1RRW8_9CHLO